MNKKEFREKVRKLREKELVRDALLLKDRKPEESLNTMFDLCRFAEKINRMKK
ncbi:MAG: hypothetical protein QMC80_05865 [Thermoplasmatales archaeon]|nr:hypothetical protein [Thermoplasmatales archaeon]